MVVAHPDAPVPHPIPVVFMGTPAFAVPSFEALVADPRFAVRLVVTQPPKPVGRGHHVNRSAVHEAAERAGAPIWTPERLRGQDALRTLQAVGATLHVVAAYGKILRRDVLEIPTRGTLNVHASLLPAYRGASPITAAILDGVARTGVSIMLLDEGLDTGPVLSSVGVGISREDTTPTLTHKLADAGGLLLVETAVQWLNREIVPQAQDDTRASITRTLTREDGLIDFTQSPERLARAERAYTPWPGLYTTFAGARVIVHGLTPIAETTDVAPGTVLAVDRDGLRVAAGGRVVKVATVQPEGKAAMPARAFAAGRPGIVGTRFGVASAS